MKSIKQVIQYIDEFYKNATDAPTSFFRNTECMEAELVALESLYEFIVDDSRKSAATPTAYIDFLVDNGYGALGFTKGIIDPELGSLQGGNSTAPSMNDYAQFWRAYLKCGKRLTPRVSGE